MITICLICSKSLYFLPIFLYNEKKSLNKMRWSNYDLTNYKSEVANGTKFFLRRFLWNDKKKRLAR